jgi:hypothetical protein
MTVEQLQEHENEGRRLATVLLDAGFCPKVLRELRTTLLTHRELVIPDQPLVELVGRVVSNTARFNGALAVLEERGL